MSRRKQAVAHQESLLIGHSRNASISGHPSRDLQRSGSSEHSYSDLLRDGPSKESQMNGQACKPLTKGSSTDIQMVEETCGIQDNGAASDVRKNGFMKEIMTAGSASDFLRSGSLPVRGTVVVDYQSNELQRSSTYTGRDAPKGHVLASLKNGAKCAHLGPSECIILGSEERPGLLSPPTPPPSPPVTPGTIPLPSSSLARNARVKKPTGNSSVPRENVDNWDRLFWEAFRADVEVHTEDGGIIPAHSAVLAMASPVLKAYLEDWACSWPYRISMHGVPYDAVEVFLRFLYSSRFEEEEMEKFCPHLLVLSHAYCVPALKRLCIQHWEKGFLNIENATDILQLAKLCDAPRLHLLCYRLVLANFQTVSRTEAWRVMRASNPSLEQEILIAVVESDSKKEAKSRKIEEDKVYAQLHDAMEALVHICRDGCRTIGPHDKVFDAQKQGTCHYPACKGLESLVRHFAGCKLKVSGGCVHCKRMWQLLELHSRMCQEASCKVPLCGHFKNKIGQNQKKRDETRWNLLVNKVVSAKNASSTSAFSIAAVSAKLEQVA